MHTVQIVHRFCFMPATCNSRIIGMLVFSSLLFFFFSFLLEITPIWVEWSSALFKKRYLKSTWHIICECQTETSLIIKVVCKAQFATAYMSFDFFHSTSYLHYTFNLQRLKFSYQRSCITQAKVSRTSIHGTNKASTVSAVEVKMPQTQTLTSLLFCKASQFIC